MSALDTPTMRAREGLTAAAFRYAKAIQRASEPWGDFEAANRDAMRALVELEEVADAFSLAKAEARAAYGGQR